MMVRGMSLRAVLDPKMGFEEQLLGQRQLHVSDDVPDRCRVSRPPIESFEYDRATRTVGGNHFDGVLLGEEVHHVSVSEDQRGAKSMDVDGGDVSRIIEDGVDGGQVVGCDDVSLV